MANFFVVPVGEGKTECNLLVAVALNKSKIEQVLKIYKKIPDIQRIQTFTPFRPTSFALNAKKGKFFAHLSYFNALDKSKSCQSFRNSRQLPDDLSDSKLSLSGI